MESQMVTTVSVCCASPLLVAVYRSKSIVASVLHTVCGILLFQMASKTCPEV